MEELEAIGRFGEGVFSAVASHVPCVKIQLACFERYGAAGFGVYEQLLGFARQLGLLVIADAKRGDIGSSAAHYASAFLCGDLAADGLTVNTLFGSDGLQPFLEIAMAQGKGLFALVRTTNPGGDAIQNLALKDGRTVSEAIGDVVAACGTEPPYIGRCGYSLLGAVVGATRPAQAKVLRRRLPQQMFLVPGFGTQGGSVDDVKACFKSDGTGALISASRSIIEAGCGPDWQSQIESAAIKFKKQVASIL